MGYRGEDVSRTPADWGHQAPGQSPAIGRGDAGPWVDEAQGYGNGDYDGYASDGSGYQSGDGYGGYPQQEQAQYGQGAPYGAPVYDETPGYGQPGDYGYQPPGGGDGYGSGPEDPYGAPGGAGQGYQAPVDGYGERSGYPARHSSGSYPALPDGDDGYQGRDAGNDWYGGQPAAASGASFADTGAYALNGRIIDEYGTGPNQTMHGRAQLPPPAQPGVSGPQSFPHTGEQERYDDYGDYPGYGGDQRQGGGTGAFPAAGRNPTGGYPAVGRNTGEYPTTIGNPTGGYPAVGRSTGEYPTTIGNPTGGYPAVGRNTGEYPTTVRNPSGGYPAATDGDYDAYTPDAYDQAYGYDNAAAGYGTSAPYQDGYGSDGGRRGGPGGRARTKKGAARKGARPAGGRRSTLTLVLGSVLVLVVVIAAAYFLVLKPHPSTPNPNAGGRLPTAGASPSDQACVQLYGTYCHIQSRTLDPAPLTLAELYPPVVSNETNGKVTSSFTLETTKLDTTCSSAVIGADLITALKTGQCNQVLRASYVSGDGKIMGTIGVINLVSTNQAHYAGKVVGQSDFIAPLAAKTGVAKKLGQGTGVVEAQYKGHYLILTWSEFANGSNPSTTAEANELEQFNSELVAGTANISLSERMINGDTKADSPSVSPSASPSASASASK